MVPFLRAFQRLLNEVFFQYFEVDAFLGQEEGRAGDGRPNPPHSAATRHIARIT